MYVKKIASVTKFSATTTFIFSILTNSSSCSYDIKKCISDKSVWKRYRYTFQWNHQNLKFLFSWKLKLEKKTAKNFRNGYDADKRIISKVSKILKPNFNSTNWNLESKCWENFTSLSLILSEKKAIKERNGRVGPVYCFK